MISHEICNLRSKGWAQQVGWRDLKSRMEDDHRHDIDQWKVTPWQRVNYGSPMRSYLVTSEGGAIYAIFIRKA